MKKLLIAAALHVCLCANAANWVAATASAWPLTDTTATIVEFDADSLKLRGGFRQAWVRYNHYPARWSLSGSGKLTGSATQLTLFDCKNSETATMQYLEHVERFGRGMAGFMAEHQRAEAVASMQVVVPGTFGETMLNYACSQPLK